MLRRELAIALRARLVWVQAALAALLIGHGFVLAIDLYTAGSRSVEGSTLMAREFDPLLGIVRPTLGGLYLAVSLLGAIAAARGLSVERERRTLSVLLLQTGAPARVALTKLAGAIAAVGLQLVAVVVLLLGWLAAGGHLSAGETLVALGAHFLYLCLVASIALATAAWTRSLAQAATAALLVVGATWAIDASEGFAALAWLGRALNWSVTTHLEPMEHGIFALGAALWMLVVSAGAVALAWLGLRRDFPWPQRAGGFVAILIATALVGAVAHDLRRAYDVSETQRNSLPPAAEQGLRQLPDRIELDVYLDRDDARRTQLERDTLTKLRLARPDVIVRMPLDERPAPAEGERVEGYGRIVVRAGGGERETYSTSRRELVTLIFEAAGKQAPDWSKTEYPGYPLVIEGARRTWLLALAYGILPLGFAAAGAWITWPRRRRK